MARAQVIACVIAVGCRAHHTAHDDAPLAHAPRDTAAAPADAADPWPELARFPRVEPLRVVPLATKASVPRFDVAGPILVGSSLAVVASSQFGFVAVDYERGQVAWSKPAGLHVAPPLARKADVVLIGDCSNPPDVPAGERLLGCLRVVTPTGQDLSYVAIHGRGKDIEAFGDEPGAQHTWAAGDHALRWRRGERAIVVDALTGVATAAAPADPPLHVIYKDRAWDITRTALGNLVGTGRTPRAPAWRTSRGYAALLGAVYLPEQSPMVRAANAGAFHGIPEVTLFDIDATGSLHGQVAFPVPGIALFGQAIDAVGDTALAIRLDASLARDFIAGYAANALLMWVYPLPRQQRVDPIGIAIAPDAVVAFHDGDTLTILPELSAPPTAPGAARLPLENTTP